MNKYETASILLLEEMMIEESSIPCTEYSQVARCALYIEFGEKINVKPNLPPRQSTRHKISEYTI
jgi:hypothetical protein